MSTNDLATWANKCTRNMEVSDKCPLSEMERENTFHAFCRCPHAVELWQAMVEHWQLQGMCKLVNSGSEWRLQLMDQLSEGGWMRRLLLLWRCWYVHNEMTHEKPAPSIEASCRFLLSSAKTLMGIQQCPKGDFAKGKMVIRDDDFLYVYHDEKVMAEHLVKWLPPL